MSLASNTPSLQSILDTVNALPDKVDTSGTATAADIYIGKTATVNDVKFTGTNPWNDENVTPYVTEALAALAEHGVDSTGKGLADLAALIAGIEAGSLDIATGEFTISADSQYFLVSHGLGKTPKILIFWVTTYVKTANSLAGGIGIANIDISDANIPIANTGTSLQAHDFYPGEGKSCKIADDVTGKLTQESAFTLANDDSFQIGSNSTSYNYYLRSGKTYRWVAIA